ncbi:DUF6902 family protein [Tateyamaria pelophila]|uniref:DUF6902 family protein n=1 Tax=Tateyamaria pelophila TaxID=328415 RepID=UPI001CBA776E|nr:hypothetical protein [Tateyamaria pelophila]
MSNIIALNAPARRQRLSDRIGDLLTVFAGNRRTQEDVYWLKENAELLNILECSGQTVPSQGLAIHAAFYDSLVDRLRFFPQYYRLLLSIGLDLEDLGMPGDAMARACEWVASSGLPDAELSDLQRAEARRLLARRGVRHEAADEGLNDRLRAFIGRPATFALPNKKAAYELTHIVFYLSEYGRRDPQLDDTALRSLEFAGIVAFLDQDLDLLAEICVATRQGGGVPHPIWEDAVRHGLSGFEVSVDDKTPLVDDYHEYLVSTWSMLMMGRDDSGVAVPRQRCLFHRPPARESALRAISVALLSLGERRADWTHMRRPVTDLLSPDAVDILEAAERSSPQFEAFFEGFARA